MSMEAILPDGTVRMLSNVDRFDYQWMNNYIYADEEAPVLPKGTTMQIVSPQPVAGFVHVRTADGKDGWVWAKNLKMSVAFATTAVSSTISPNWTKYDPQITHFTNANGTICNDGGDDHDRTTYRYKDRTDIAADHQDSYHRVSAGALRALPYFASEHTKYLDSFTLSADRDEVMKYQGIPVELDAYMLDDLRSEHAEGTNCSSDATTDVDWHLVMGEHDQAIAMSIFAEITPRVRQTHTHWRKADFKNGVHLKIDGWLMYDPDHKDQITTHKRGTLWEVHPIMKVWKRQPNGSWLDLDQAH